MVDWDGELEAVCDDGSIIRLDRRDTTKHSEYQWYVTIEGKNIMVVADSGFTGIGWTIRNVEPVTNTTPPIPANIAERAVELMALIANGNYASMDAQTQARSIMAELEPVSADLIAAREIADELTANVGYYASGKHDDHNMVKSALNGVQRGRQLAGEGR